MIRFNYLIRNSPNAIYFAASDSRSVSVAFLDKTYLVIYYDSSVRLSEAGCVARSEIRSEAIH